MFRSMRWVAVWLGVACSTLLGTSPSPAQQPGISKTLQGHKNPVKSVAFSPDGKTLASGCADGTVTLWDVASGRETFPPVKHNHLFRVLAFSPSGKTLASA